MYDNRWEAYSMGKVSFDIPIALSVTELIGERNARDRVNSGNI